MRLSSTLWSLFLGAFAFGCTRAEVPDRAHAMRLKTGVEVKDDLDFAGLADGLRAQGSRLKSGTKTMTFGEKSVPGWSYAAKLTKLADAIASGQAAQVLRDEFETYEVYGSDSWGEVRLTSYFEPIIKGSRTATSEYSAPVLRRPEDLLVIQTSAYWDPIRGVSNMRGRLDSARKNHILPYFSRQEIDAGALRNRGLELAYVDPVDAFFMQVQGSGTIELEDGSQQRVGYADQNGFPYTAIGKFLFDVIPKESMSMETIAAHLRTLPPDQRTELLEKNPSYVFFEKRQGDAVTSNTTRAIAGRTIATDGRFFPKGALALLTFELPPESVGGSPRVVSRLVLDQDTGGAIRGGGRVDLFWGRGADAGKIAGSINQTARLYYLAPK